ncbi:NUDIX hydrolase [Aliidiomarina sanyensis]|uniref:NUDIX hydrolase n=1 Tax=Aliidiomarina sanyensis TaxID=1249555 RepID=A0A432WNR7_9GAMM|nr:NUDIX hydrolase [Aliidiomarina sanyensis]RUO35415.1 NUDIX hydrolase [Aliidiomarina sanyensis]
MTKQTVYANPWFSVLQDGQWHYVHEENSENGALVLCFVGERLVLVRVPRAAHSKELWEAPRGYGEPGESAEVAAARELLEETGYHVSAEDMELLGRVKPNTAILTTAVNVFRCRLPADAIPVQGDSDAPALNEVSAVALFGEDDLRGMITNGELTCGITLAALMIAKVM